MRPGTRKTLSLLGIFLAVWLVIRFLLPLSFPFLLGTALALAAEPAVRFLRRHLHLPRAAAEWRLFAALSHPHSHRWCAS